MADLGLSTWLTIGSTIASTAFGAIGAIQEGKSQQRAAEYEAQQLEKRAKAAQARASHEAAEDHRQKRLALSRARLVGAASGSDRAFDLEGDLEAEGQYRALSSIFEGNEVAAGRRDQAAARRYDGEVARRAGFIRAGGSVLRGGASLLDKYGADWT